jgi:hypothetical protein
MAHRVIMSETPSRLEKRDFRSMAVEIKTAVEDAAEAGAMGADIVSGAAVTVAENVSRAVTHPVREARKLERRGAQANKRLSRDVAELIDDTEEVIEAVMPERVALLGIHVIKQRARRKDLVGDVAYRTLELVNGGLETMVRTLSRLENATTPPARPGTARTRTARPVRRTARKRTSTARRGAARKSA